MSQGEFKTHKWDEWRATWSHTDKVHLADKIMVKMGQYVIIWSSYPEGNMDTMSTFNFQTQLVNL